MAVIQRGRSAVSVVSSHRIRLESAEPVDDRYPLAVRLTIILGSSMAVWGVILLTLWKLLHR